MSNKKLKKQMLIISLSATMVFSAGNFSYANIQSLPNGTIVSQDGKKYLADSNGKKYSGWFLDSKEDWYFFNDKDMDMKTGWHQDDKDGYFYYLNLSDGKMVTGWNTIEGKDYFFQPVRDMGNYNFNNEQEKWLYSINSRVPYGAMYVNTTTPDGTKVDNSGARVTKGKNDSGSTPEFTDDIKNGWLISNGKWYYYDNGSIAKEKWLNLNGKWFYVIEDGSMVSNNWKDIGGKSYYFGSDGAMYVNTTTPDGYSVDQNGAKKIYVFKGLEAFSVTSIKVENGRCYLTGNYEDLVPYTSDYDEYAYPYDTIVLKENITIEVNDTTTYLPYDDSDIGRWRVVTNINELVEEINDANGYGVEVLLDLEGDQVKTIRGVAWVS